MFQQLILIIITLYVNIYNKYIIQICIVSTSSRPFLIIGFICR